LNDSGFGDIKVYIYDSNRWPFLPGWVAAIATDPEALKYVAGVAVHYYLDTIVPPHVLDTVHALYPNLPLLNTEAANYANFYFPFLGLPLVPSDNPSFGMWQAALDHTQAMISDFNHWLTGWMEFSMVVEANQPRTAGNLDAAILVNASGGEFLKQPLWYAMGHFSKFIPPGSKRIGLEVLNVLTSNLPMVAFLRPDGLKVIVACNDLSNDWTAIIAVQLSQLTAKTISLSVPGDSIVTAIFQ